MFQGLGASGAFANHPMFQQFAQAQEAARAAPGPLDHLPDVSLEDIGGLEGATDYSGMMQPRMDDYWQYATGPQGAFGTAAESNMMGVAGRARGAQLNEQQNALMQQATTAGLSGQFSRRLGQELSRGALESQLGGMQQYDQQTAMAGTEAYGNMMNALASADVQGSQDRMATIMNILNQRTDYQVGKMSAGATRSAGKSSMMGSIIGAAILCWVAREVYGERNPQWLMFRAWLLDDAPAWFRKLYITYGPRFAEFISDKPRVKRVIRSWMDGRIRSYVRKHRGSMVSA